MTLLSNKSAEITGKIAALKSLADKKVGNSKLIKKSKNLIDTLLDIYKQLGGYKEMIETIEDILVKKLSEIELIIKSTIKTSLKQIISCGIEPTITEKLTLTGVTFTIKNIDPLNILTTDPISDNGQLLYFDNEKGVNSKDFNVFLYTLIRNTVANNLNSNSAVWYNNNNKPLCTLTYYEYDSINKRSNVINVKIDNTYLGKKLSAFISDYLDSIKLFNNTQVLSSIFNDIMGVRTFSSNKTIEQLMAEKMIEKLCDDILNNVNESDVLDESFYEFSNDTYNTMMEESEDKRLGIFRHIGDVETNITVDETIVLQALLDLKNTDSKNISDQTNIIKDSIDKIADNVVGNNQNVSDADKFSLKMNFIQKIISKLMNTITMMIFSPKIIYLFVMTSSLLGLDENTDIKTFIKNNINIFKIIIAKIRDVITDIIIKKIKEMLAPMVASVVKRLAKERMSNYKKQLLTLKLF